MTEQRSSAIDLLKAVAALLIINSHLEPLYPRPWMAADGMLGNTLFFFTTGFTLAGSLHRRRDETLLQFLWKRLSRMLPGIWLVTVLVPSKDVDWTSPVSLLGVLFYPTYYTFVKTATPLYPLFFVSVRKLSPVFQRRLAVGLLVAAMVLAQRLFNGAADVPWSELGNLGWGLYFAGTLLLGAVAFHAQAKVEWPKSKAVGTWFLLVLAYFFFRFSATAAAGAMVSTAMKPWLALTLPLCIGVVLMGFVSASSPGLARWIANIKPVNWAVAFLAAHSWETYLLHEGIARWGFIHALPFPLSLLLVVVLTLTLAPLLKWLSDLPFRRSKLRR